MAEKGWGGAGGGANADGGFCGGGAHRRGPNWPSGLGLTRVLGRGERALSGERATGSARCAEVAESNGGGEGRRASSDELMCRQEGEIGKERGSARFLSPQRSSGAAMSSRRRSGTAARR